MPGRHRAPVLQPPADVPVADLGDGSIAIRLRSEQTAGRLGMIENRIPPGFDALPWHVHPAFDETFFVLEGALTFGVGEQRLEAGPGAVVHVPGGTPHRFTEPAGRPARLLIIATPGGHERYFQRLAELYRDSGPEGPSQVDLGALMEAEGLAVVPQPDAAPSRRLDEAPGLTLRRAVAADAPAIAAVFDAAVRAHWTYLGDLASEPMFSAQDWDRLVADHEPPNVLLVAVDAAGIVGYTAVHPQDGEMFLLFVHPAHAGRGVGRTLLAAAHDALRDAGCSEAFLFVHEQNERAIAVYSAAGYRPDGSDRVSDFRGTPIHELRLVKRL